MKKINAKILSIPPYISTSWKNISLLHLKEHAPSPILIITLQNRTKIEVPNLDMPTIEEIFSAHSKFLEQESPSSKEVKSEAKSPEQFNGNVALSMGIPFPFTMDSEGMGNLGSFLQHNPAQAHSPDLPQEVIEKIRTVTEAIGVNLDQMNAPKAEPHCNCMYCQIARAIQHNSEGIEVAPNKEEEHISDEDLKFRSWDIKQEGDKLYLVTNPLDQNEHYQVYLGTPIGCTCGQKNCEHIRIVLSS